MHRCTTLMCHCEEANGRRGNLAGHGWMTGYLRRNRNCLPEIATTPAGSRNDKSGSLTPMNLCLKYASLQGAQGTPLQTQSVCTFLSSICTNCECLPEIAPQGHFLALRAQGATGAERPRNDRAGGLPEAQKIRGCDLQSRRFFGFDQALPAQPRTSLSLCSTRALMLARAGLRYWRGSK